VLAIELDEGVSVIESLSRLSEIDSMDS